MAIDSHLKAYTITDLKVAPVTGDTPGTLVDVPGIQKMTLKLSTESVVLRGDNKQIAAVDKGNTGTVEFTEGGISFAAMDIMLGTTTSDSGTTPNVVRTMNVFGSTSRPYFFVVGQSINDNGGVQDLHIAVWKVKLTDDLEFTAGDGEFIVPTFGGVAVSRSDNDKLFSLVHHETKAALAIPA
jgi:hypothetical protein